MIVSFLAGSSTPQTRPLPLTPFHSPHESKCQTPACSGKTAARIPVDRNGNDRLPSSLRTFLSSSECDVSATDTILAQSEIVVGLDKSFSASESFLSYSSWTIDDSSESAPGTGWICFYRFTNGLTDRGGQVRQNRHR
jgi:hypothetical protein